MTAGFAVPVVASHLSTVCTHSGWISNKAAVLWSETSRRISFGHLRPVDDAPSRPLKPSPSGKLCRTEYITHGGLGGGVQSTEHVSILANVRGEWAGLANDQQTTGDDQGQR